MQAMMNDGVSATSLVGGLGRGLMGIVTKPIGGAANLVVHTGQGLLRGTGWQADLKPRVTPSLQKYSNVSNASLKYAWKLLVALPSECRQIICAADATMLTKTFAYSPVTVILTPQVSFKHVLFWIHLNSRGLPLFEGYRKIEEQFFSRKRWGRGETTRLIGTKPAFSHFLKPILNFFQYLGVIQRMQHNLDNSSVLF